MDMNSDSPLIAPLHSNKPLSNDQTETKDTHKASLAECRVVSVP